MHFLEDVYINAIKSERDIDFTRMDISLLSYLCVKAYVMDIGCGSDFCL